MTPDLAALRQDYRQATLRRADMLEDPLAQFRAWFAEAQAAQLQEPNAFVLGTVDAEGTPSTRTVLLKALDDTGFTFFTNYTSRKGRALAAHPRAAMTFLWLELERQIHIEGVAERVSATESDAYFAVRPYASQIGALASAQSTAIAKREELETRFAQCAAQYPEGGPIPRPEHWGGYRVRPTRMEFWQGRRSRLHDRLCYTRGPAGWEMVRLCP